MAEPSAPLVNPLCVISPYYCAPYPVDLAIVRKVLTISDGNFVVTDAKGNIIFKVKGVLLTLLHQRRIIVDAAGNPVVTIRQKVRTVHSRWQAFKGESTDSKDLLFNAKRHSVLYLKTKLDVFLAHNTTEEVCDFKVEGSWFERSCVIYAGDSSTVITKVRYSLHMENY
ncbi:protein LURP-one-related 15-like [Fagus crenata]